MSFSFRIAASSIAEAKSAAGAKLSEIIAAQPTHERDKAGISKTIDTYLDMLTPTDGQIIEVSVAGSIGWLGQADKIEGITSAAISVSARCFSEDVKLYDRNS